MPRPLRDYLEIRSAFPTSFSDDAERVLVSSNLTGTFQLYRVPRTGGPPVALTAEPEPVGGAYLPRRGDVLMTMDSGGNEHHQLYLLDDEPGAVPRPFVVDPGTIHWPGGATRDGRLAAYASNVRNGVDFDVWVRPLDAGSGGDKARCVFDVGGWCRPAGFSPDGRWLAVVRLTERNGDNDLWLVDLAARPGTAGALVHASPHDDEAAFGAPAWRPDSSGFHLVTDTGRDVAAVAFYDMGRRRLEYVLERPAGAVDVTTSRRGDRLLVTTTVDGYTGAELLDPSTLERTGEVPLPGRGVAAFVWSPDGRYLGYQFSAPNEPGDAWTFDCHTGATARLTRSPGDVPAAELIEPEVHRYRSFDGEQVPVFLYRPRPGPGGGGGAPVVVWVHGGPEAQMTPTFMPVVQYLLGQGYAVAAPNVRGSTGYGKRWQHLDDVEKRLDSVADLGALHDWLATRPGIDASRAALVGGSYGGYMVLAGLVFQPDRWAAGVTVVGISSLVTFLENTSVWRRAFREREYGSLEHDRQFLLEASPLTHLDRLRAPLFIIHGANDPRVPVGEAEQLHAALAAKGIPSELLVYPDEGHGLAKLANRLDAWPRAVAFLDRVLRA